MTNAIAGNVWALPLETDIIIWLQSLGGKGSFLYYLMNFFSMFGKEIVVFFVVLALFGPDKQGGRRIALTMFLAFIGNCLIKNIFCRERPFNSDRRIQNLRDESGYSFPSGHSMLAASVYPQAALQLKNKRAKTVWTSVAAAVALLVALSRMYVGAHYLTDVVCGLALGFAAMLTAELLCRLKRNYLVWAGLLVVGLAGFFYCDSSDFFTGYGALLGFVAGMIFDDKVVRFAPTKVWWRILLRTLGGLGIFLGLNTLLKLPFSSLIETNAVFERYFRVARYAVCVFLVVGVYPMCFALLQKRPSVDE